MKYLLQWVKDNVDSSAVDAIFFFIGLAVVFIMLGFAYVIGDILYYQWGG